MGLFDRFRKRPHANSISLPQLCYDVAYFVLPHYAHHRTDKIAELCTSEPRAAGPFFYAMACVQRKVEPVKEHAERFRWHHGDLDAALQYFVLEFPAPPPVDLANLPRDRVLSAMPKLVLAPYFAAVLRPRSAAGPTHYYILGQAPLGGGTTLRTVTPDHTNANLGPGPQPTLDAFLTRHRTNPRRS
jgi:hypothetical protein